MAGIENTDNTDNTEDADLENSKVVVGVDDSPSSQPALEQPPPKKPVGAGAPLMTSTLLLARLIAW